VADVHPFRGLRYRPERVGDLGRVLCPPYDQISPALQERLYAQSPYNAVRLEYGRTEPGDNGGENRYVRARRTLQAWLAEGVLAPDPFPALYVVEESYPMRGRERVRLGLVGALRLVPWSEGVVLPHEETRPGPKADRLRLMEATGAVFSPIMALYRDEGGEVRSALEGLRQRVPEAEARMGEVRYRVWTVGEPAVQRRVHRALAGLRLYIADGHHRYETALAYRERRRAHEGDAGPDRAFHFILCALYEMEDPGMGLGAFHRLLTRASAPLRPALLERTEALFVTEEEVPLRPGGLAPLAEALEGMDGEGPPRLALVDGPAGRVRLLRLREGAPLPPAPIPDLHRCDAWLLHRAVLEPVLGPGADRGDQGMLDYTSEAEEVGRALEAGQAWGAFLLRPLPRRVFRRLVEQGVRLPPKTTLFYPKLPTGLVFFPLEGECPAP